MSNRSNVTAALALAAATILTIAACGSSVNGSAPSELAADVQALADVAQAANGKSFADVTALIDSEKFTTATKHIEDWVTANCGG